jgi:Fe-S oxidoreductase
LIQSVSGRWLAERVLGLSAARKLPPIARETFLRHAAGRKWTRQQTHGGLKVCYFVDHFANYHDPDIGKALGEVMQQNEVNLYVPYGQTSSGMARITMGDVIGARKVARRNIRILADAVRGGYTILATEPSAVLCLKHEYPNLLGDEDSLLVAEHTMEAAQYLWHLHEGNRLSLDFSPVDLSVAYHHPCHLRVLDPEPVTTKLLSLVPGLEVQRIEAGCTGMAGTWGLQKKNYRNSLRIGWPLISAMRASTSTMATTCGACRMQIEHGAAQATIHPIKLLAYAYGRMPKVQKEIEAAK